MPPEIMKKIMRLSMICSLFAISACASGGASFDQTHSVAYNVTHAAGLHLNDIQRPASLQPGDLSKVLDAGVLVGESSTIVGQAPGAVGSNPGGFGLAGLGLVNALLSSAPESLPLVIGWVPASLADTPEKAQQTLINLYAAAVRDEVAPTRQVVKHSDHGLYDIIESGCPKVEKLMGSDFDKSCSFTLRVSKGDVSDNGRTSSPYFVPMSEAVLGPIARHIDSFPDKRTVNLDMDRGLALRISKRLPTWVFLYLPGRYGHATAVLQGGGTAHFFILP